MKGKIALVVLVVAIATAAAAALFLKKTQEKVERATAPVEVAAPDLFPADTLLFAAAHRMDESWDAVEGWWKGFEPSATCYLLRRWWDRSKSDGSLPPGVREGVADLEKAMDAAEARLGYRPNTKQFFDTYGKYTAFGLLPGTGEGKPRMLLVVKLPGEAAMEVLRQKLGGVARRHDPPEIRGYPVFVEEGGRLGKVLYGVGGGYLFLADDASVIGDALGRLPEKDGKAAAGPKAPVLSADPVFKRTVPAKWEEVGLAFFARKKQQFVRWNEQLGLLDEYLAHSFVLAPGDDAVALAAVRMPGSADFEMRASFDRGRKAPAAWADALPAGLHWAYMAGPPATPASRQALLADLEEVRGKAIWKEADALVADGPRLRRILEEALGPEGVPEEEILRRLAVDWRLLGTSLREGTERSLLGARASWCMAAKEATAGGSHMESLFAARFGPAESLLLAAALDMATDRQSALFPDVPAPVERIADPGFFAWRLSVDRLLEVDRFREFAPILQSYRGLDPAFVLTEGSVYLVFGKELFDDLRGRIAGKVPPLAADPLFVEALALVPPGPSTLDYTRPGEYYRGSVEGTFRNMGTMLESMNEPDVSDLFQGVFAAGREVARWGSLSRATVSASYDDPAVATVWVDLVDPKQEAVLPRIALPGAELRAPGILPAGTFLLVDARVDVRPGVKAFTDAFLKGLPGGRARWDELREEIPMPPEALEDRLDAMLVDVKGEAGMALAVPAAANPDELKDTQDLLDRIPAHVLFAAYANPENAFGTFAGIFDEVAAAVSEGEELPFAARVQMYAKGQGPRPLEVTSSRAKHGAREVASLTFSWPEGPRGKVLTAGLAVVRDGDLLLLTTSLPVAAAMASAPAGGPGTLAERAGRELPAGTLPKETPFLLLARADGFADAFALYARPLAPQLVGLSLRGIGGRPSEDRVAAHQEGWKKVAHLVEDLLRSGHWVVGSTTRDGNTTKTTIRTLKGR